jgi:hypothetical protein
VRYGWIVLILIDSPKEVDLVLPLLDMTHLLPVGVAVGRARDLSWSFMHRF